MLFHFSNIARIDLNPVMKLDFFKVGSLQKRFYGRERFDLTNLGAA